MTTVKGLLIMDVDSTLIEEEVIDLLGHEAGLADQVAHITARAMQGELDFKQALAERVACLKGLPQTILDKVYTQIHLTPGAKALIEEMHERGYKIGLVSGGFHETVDRLAKELDIDYVEANSLEVVQGRLTGRTQGTIVTKEVKLQKLKEWADKNHLSLSQTIAMGDGANDLPMIQAAGIGVAFCAKPIVRQQATYHIEERNLYRLVELIDHIKKGCE